MQARLRRMIDVLHEQRVALARRQHADRLGGHRPLRQPLHRRAEAVGAAEQQMVALRLRQQLLDRGAPARHLGVGKARNIGRDDTGEMGGSAFMTFSLVSSGLSR